MLLWLWLLLSLLPINIHVCFIPSIAARFTLRAGMLAAPLGPRPLLLPLSLLWLLLLLLQWLCWLLPLPLLPWWLCWLHPAVPL